jgi:hypothetical protein
MYGAAGPGRTRIAEEEILCLRAQPMGFPISPADSIVALLRYAILRLLRRHLLSKGGLLALPVWLASSTPLFYATGGGKRCGETFGNLLVQSVGMTDE